MHPILPRAARVALRLAVALIIPFNGSAAAAAIPDPVACTGYPEDRTFLEAQDWWTPTGKPVEGGSRHIHLGTCFPWKQDVHGTVGFDIQIQLHANPGTLTKVDVQLFGNSGGMTLASKSISETCPDQCAFWYHLDVDTARWLHDGRTEFRFHATVIAPDGSKGFTSSGWQAYLRNGHPVSDYRSSDNFTEGRGWYTGASYTNARLTCGLPVATVSGVWTFSVKIAAGSGGSPVSHSFVSIDPHFHWLPVDRGLVLLDKSGTFTGNLSIDTRTLPNGIHRLFLRGDAPISVGTNSGIQTVLFNVRN